MLATAERLTFNDHPFDPVLWLRRVDSGVTLTHDWVTRKPTLGRAGHGAGGRASCSVRRARPKTPTMLPFAGSAALRSLPSSCARPAAVQTLGTPASAMAAGRSCLSLRRQPAPPPPPPPPHCRPPSPAAATRSSASWARVVAS